MIVTGPPVVTAQIHYDPHLPADRRQLLQRFPQGTTIKCQAVYDRPYWRDSGLTGQAVALDGPVRVTFDNSPPDGSPGVLLGFIEGAAARDYQRRSAAERKAAVLNAFATYFGEAARQPRQYFEMNWTHEAWTRGCYEGYLAPGRPDGTRHRVARALQPTPLGGRGDLRLLVRLHGRRGAFRPARRGRGAGRALVALSQRLEHAEQLPHPADQQPLLVDLHPDARRGGEDDVVAGLDRHVDACTLPPVEARPDRQHDALLGWWLDPSRLGPPGPSGACGPGPVPSGPPGRTGAGAGA